MQEPTELEYVEQMIEDLGLGPDDTIQDMIEALEDEEAACVGEED
jgi:hypothetical protein